MMAYSKDRLNSLVIWWKEYRMYRASTWYVVTSAYKKELEPVQFRLVPTKQ